MNAWASETVVDRNRLPAWFIAFRESSDPRWWQRRLKPGFRHCFAFSFDPVAQMWLVFDPTLDATYLRYCEAERIPAITERCHVILKVLVNTETKVVRPRPVLSCVTQCAQLVGLDSLVVTPWQLFCALSKRGATISFARTDDQEGLDGRLVWRGRSQIQS